MFSRLIFIICTLIFTQISHAEKMHANCDKACQIKIQNSLDTYRALAGIPGMSISISYPSKDYLSQINFYSGTTIKNGNIRVSKDHFFEMGSVTKSMVAVILLQLEAEGKLSLNDPIIKWLPKEYLWKDWQTVTIQQLLHMTSGIYGYLKQPFLDYAFTYPSHYFSNIELTRTWSFYHKPNTIFSPGSNWDYSNTNYILADMIIENITGKTLQENLYARIFKPLNLFNTIYQPNLIPADLKNMVHGYRVDNNTFQDITNQNISFASGAGAIISTSEDMNKWARALLTGKLLSPTQQQKLFALVCPNTQFAKTNTCKPGTSLSKDTDQTGFSFGLMYKRASFGPMWFYGGTTFGYITRYYYLPEKDLLIFISGSSNQDRPDKDYLVLLRYMLNSFK